MRGPGNFRRVGHVTPCAPLRQLLLVQARTDGRAILSKLGRYSAELMGHGIDNNIDRERVRGVLGEAVKKVKVLSFPFPAVAIIGVIARDHH